MSEYAPPAIYALFNRVKVLIPTAVFSGIRGDVNHTYGDHRCRNALPPTDYSVQFAEDRQGDGNACSALDISLPPEQMKLVTQRLIAAMQAGDPRVRALREFFGTQDGKTVIGFDRRSPTVAADDRFSTSDGSHLWHIHLSFYRMFATNAAVLLLIADVMAGVPLVKPAVLHRAWPAYMPAGHYFGLITGPVESHGGYHASERPDVAAIQQRLRMFGQPTAAIVVDGRFGPSTAAGVQWWQKARWPSTTASKLGKLDAVAWTRLFTY